MNKCRKDQAAAAHRVTVRHNSRDTTQVVLNVDGTCSGTTGRGRAGRWLVRGRSGPAGLSLGKWLELVSINLPAAGGGSGKEAQKRPQPIRYIHTPPPRYTHRNEPKPP